MREDSFSHAFYSTLGIIAAIIVSIFAAIMLFFSLNWMLGHIRIVLLALTILVAVVILLADDLFSEVPT